MNSSPSWVRSAMGAKDEGGRDEGGVSVPCLLNLFRLHPSGFIPVNNRADRNFDHFGDGGAPVLLLSLPVRPTLGLDDRLVEKIRKVVGMDIGPENDVSTTATVAAVGPPARHEFLAPETDAAAPAIAGLGKNFDSIDKHMEGKFSRSALAKCHRLGRLSSRGRESLAAQATSRSASAPESEPLCCPWSPAILRRAPWFARRWRSN